MQVAIRRLIIVSAISLGGATTGVMLGNFVAGRQSPNGLEELASYSSQFDAGEPADTGSEQASAFAARPGPRHYECTGCDASLYHDTISEAVSAASIQPLPLYQPDDTPITPVLRQDVIPAAPRRGPPPIASAAVALLASPVVVSVNRDMALKQSLPKIAATRQNDSDPATPAPILDEQGVWRAD